jgi:hypothetical protein
MARTTGGGARRNPRRAAPSANELLNTFGKEIFGGQFRGAVTAASKGEFNKITDIMYDDTESMDHYNPVSYDNLAATMKKDGSTGSYTSFDQDQKKSRARAFYEVIDLNTDLDIPSNLRVPGYKGPQLEEDTSPADLTVVPTSTTNYQRPRTVAAGYDEDEEKLTVMFRDGTLYNYYEVDENEWKAFKANRSKGAIIAQMLDFKPRGEADSISGPAQQAFYRFSRGAQIYSKGTVKGQAKTTFKTAGQKARGKNPSKGGKAPKRK